MTTPNLWVIIRVGEYYKVLASFQGGYLDGDSWRINSGILSVVEKEEYFDFFGYSGSCYRCYKGSYGTSTLAQSVLNNILLKAKEQKIDVELMPEDTDFNNLELQK